MKDLICAIKNTLDEGDPLPFSVYSSVKEQQIFNVPVVKPLLIVVLEGEKRLGKASDVICSAGSFVFLSNSAAVDMRNIPGEQEYFALLIEFERRDFEVLPASLRETSGLQESGSEGNASKGRDSQVRGSQPYLLGELEAGLEQTLRQFVEWSRFAPAELWPLRRREILQYLYHLGYSDVGDMAGLPGVAHRLHELISANVAEDLSVGALCERLAMSESSLRRKLQAEGTSLQAVKDQARLGLGLHLLQTTRDPIGLVAGRCGYQSQSRFSERFKQRFGLTPSELRKTQLTD